MRRSTIAGGPSPAAIWPVVLAAAALLVLLTYGPRLHSQLVWDDRGLILFNEALRKPLSLEDFLTPRYFLFSGEYSWRPLSTWSYYAIIRTLGESPAALRGLSLVLHLLSGLLLWLVLSYWEWPLEAAAWSVAIFWLHPAQVESLMCVAFNKEVLAACGLLAMLAAHQRRRWGLASLGLAWALLAKEAALTAPLLVVLFDWCDSRLSRAGSSDLRRSKLFFAYSAYAAFIGLYAYMRFIRLPGPTGALSSVHLPFSDRAFWAAGSWITALRVFLFPVRLRIEYFALPPGSTFDWLSRLIAGGSILLTVAACARLLWKNDRRLAFFWLWPWPFLLTTSNLVPAPALDTHLMAERWLYIPSIGWSVVLASVLIAGARRLNGTPGGLYARRAALATAVFAFFAASSMRAKEWSDETRLWAGLERIYPRSAKAAEGMGEACARQGRWTEAWQHLRRALTLREDRSDPLLAYFVPLAHGLLSWESPSLYRWLGDCQAHLGDVAKAAIYYEKSIALDPADGYSFEAMALHWAEIHRFNQARRWIDRGLRRDPHDALLLELRSRIPR